MKKKSIEDVLEHLSEMTDEERASILKEARSASKDVEELAGVIVRTVLEWMKLHQDDEDHLIAKLMTGLSKGVCSLLVTVDEAFENSGLEKPSCAFIAMLPLGIPLAVMEREMFKKMKHEQMIKEGAN